MPALCYQSAARNVGFIVAFLIISNREKDLGLVYARQIAERLRRLTDEEPAVFDYARHFVRGRGEPLQRYNEHDIAIALGGDGTILHVAKHAAMRGIPVLGVNIGRVGFMAGIEYSELDCIDRLCTGSYRTEERMMLEVRAEGSVWHALNDAVVCKGALSRMIDIGLSSNGRFLCDYRADGVIFSTPTGSTAYALSAGGPMIDPQLDSIGATPICSHSLISRTILFAPKDTLSAQTRVAEDVEAYLSVDGQDVIRLTGETPVEIRRSAVRARLIMLKDVSFYEAISGKLSGK